MSIYQAIEEQVWGHPSISVSDAAARVDDADRMIDDIANQWRADEELYKVIAGTVRDAIQTYESEHDDSGGGTEVDELDFDEELSW